MMPLRRAGAAVALLWYLGLGFGLPLLDSVLFHHDTLPRSAHVESSDAECHRGECSLEAPGAPQSPAGSPVGVPRIAVLGDHAVQQPLTDAPRARQPARSHAPRAPPQFD